jgi:ATP-binding cassette subfamily B multidrug efflux pump
MRTPYFLILFVVVAVLLLRMDWQLGLISMGFMPIVMLQSAVVRLQMRRLWLLVQEMMAELNTVLQENLTGIRVVKSFASEDYEERKFNKHSRDVAETTVKAERIRAANTAFMAFTFMVALGLILWFGGQRVIDGRLSPGELAQFIFYMQILSMPVRMIGWMVNSYARAASAGQRLFEILDYESPVKDSADAIPMPRTSGHVRFENVSFAYDGGANVLSNINLDVPPGKVIALLGAPGSGKSSIVNMIPRFYDPTEGQVTIDGEDVRDTTLASLRRNVGMVQQDVFLFADSIRDNIAYGREDASMDLVVQAAQVAQLHEFIESQPDRYGTAVGERGATLSGGQRQRLAIARAVLLDPPILILDDSTSSVDTRTEERIRQAMESVMKGRTTFVIAHRLSTVHRADQIVVLKRGRIAEQGTHRELLALDGLYKEIYDLQLRPQEEVMLEVDVTAPGPGRYAAT